MSTNAAGSHPLDKVVNNVMQALGQMYKECHVADPSGQAGQAVQQIMQAVSEVAKSAFGGQPTQPQGPQGAFDQASQSVNQQMMAQAQPDQGQGY